MNDVRRYHRRVVRRLHAVLGSQLVGVYAAGSVALGGYDPQRSDLDVVAVCRRSLADDAKAAVARALRHESLPCPARGLELVIYAESVVREPTPDAGYELNLNSGPAMPFRLSLSSVADAEHWYAIDRAIVREHGVVLFGPPPWELFAPIPRATLVDLLAESVRWHEEHESARGDDAILNACRAWRFATDDVWSSKTDAGGWARARLDDSAVVSDALAARRGESQPSRDRVDPFLRRARRRLESERSVGGMSRS